MSTLGKEIRLKRLMNKDSGRLLSVALDHGMARGVLPGLEDVAAALASVAAGKPDAVTLHKGIAERCFSRYAGEMALILKCTTFSPYHPAYDTWVAAVDEAIRLGADAISMGVIVGGDRQPEMLRHLGLLSRETELAGMPLVAHIYPRGEGIAENARYDLANVAYAARVAAELGVDIVKTWYTGTPESFQKVVVAARPARVVIAGGAKFDQVEDMLQVTWEALAAGVTGVTYGRNVWQHEQPARLIGALKAIIHGQAGVADALQMLHEGEAS